MNAIGPHIRQIRVAAGMSLRSTAKLAGVSATYLSLVESGKAQTPTTDRLERIAKAIHADSDDLVIRAGRVPSDVQAAIDRFPRKVTEVLRYTGVTKMKRVNL